MADSFSYNGEWPTLSWKALEEAVERSRGSSDESARHCWNCSETVFLTAARFLHQMGARLLTLAATPSEDKEVRLTYTFEVGKSSTVMLQTFTHESTIDSLFSLFACADFLEREVNNLFGIKFLGHPNLTHIGTRMKEASP